MEQNAVKVYTVLTAQFIITKNDEETIEMKHFNTKAEPIYPTTNVKEWFITHIQEPIQTEIEEFEQQGSGWSLHSIINLTVNINKLNPMRGISYVDLPAKFRNKTACINVQNDDNMCFKWAILSALHPARHAYRVSEYRRYEDELNFAGIEFPVTPNRISKFEVQNDVSVNVYILKKRKGDFETAPFHVTSKKKNQHVNLLLVQDHYVDEEEEEEEEGKELDNVEYELPRFHYVWIKDLSRLASHQLSKRGHKHHICDRCFHYFRTEEKLAAHEKDWKKVNKCKMNMPTPKNNILRFKNLSNKEKVPFVVYADFECLLKPTRDENAYQKHEALSVGYYLKCSCDDSVSKYRSFRGPEPAKWFVQELQKLANNLEEIYRDVKPMKRLTMRQVKQFNTATKCHICEKPLPVNNRVKDHCHLTRR